MPNLLGMPAEERAKEFDTPEKHRTIRREGPSAKVNLSAPNESLQKTIHGLGGFKPKRISIQRRLDGSCLYPGTGVAYT
jgi:hypothetical protein